MSTINFKSELYWGLNGFEIQIHSTQYFFSDNNHKETAYIGIAIFEEKLTNEQLQYLHQCKYTCSIFMVLNMEFLKLELYNEQICGTKTNASNCQTMEY
jgi:hypothetical protein